MSTTIAGRRTSQRYFCISGNVGLVRTLGRHLIAKARGLEKERGG